MAITTLSKARTILGISGRDEVISALIPLVEEDYLAIRNKPFESEDGETIYPTGSELTAIQMIGYRINLQKSQGVKSKSLGDHSVSYADIGDGAYPKSITGSIKRFVSFK